MDYYAPALDSVNIYTNGETFSANGLEAELKYYNPQLVNVFLNYALILGNDKDKIGDHYNFKYFPKSTLALGVSKSYRNFSASAVANLKSATEGPVSSIDASYKVDFNISYKHTLAGKEMKHTFSIKNITDSDYSIPEYVRLRTINEIPLGYRRSIFYALRVRL